jgi:hypothetical protein
MATSTATVAPTTDIDPLVTYSDVLDVWVVQCQTDACGRRYKARLLSVAMAGYRRHRDLPVLKIGASA